jgi:hypothetical protein
MMTEEQKAALRECEEWNRKRGEATMAYIKSRGYSEHPLLDNEEIEITLASAFSAGARWERDRPC